MSKIVDSIVVKSYNIVMEEQDVTKTLKVIQKHHKLLPSMRVGNCGWADDPNKWFIIVTTSKAKWGVIRKELNIARVFDNGEIPKNSAGIIFTTD